MRTLKRSLALVLAIAMVLTAFGATVVSAASYGDTSGHWAETYIDTWSNRGVIQGDGGYFRPDDTITRAEVAQVTQNVIGYMDTADNNFTDVDSSAWYADAILKLVAAGTLTGYGDGTMSPSSFMTREDAMTMLARAYGLTVENSQAAITQYSDYQNVSDYATGYVGAMTAAGYVGGYSDGTIRPKDFISRAEFVKILDNMIKLYITASGTYGPDYSGGIVMIKSSDVVLNGIVANGMVVSPQVGGNVTITNCQVSGKVVNLSSNAVISSNVEVSEPNNTTAPNNVIVGGWGGGSTGNSNAQQTVTVTFRWGDDFGKDAQVKVSKGSRISASKVPNPSSKGDDNWNGLWYRNKANAQSGAGTNFDPTKQSITGAMTLYAGRANAVPTDAPTAKPGEPTATAVPGAPTATTAPGEPTATAAPGQPTATTAPGQPTATAKPTPGVNSYKATLNVTGGTGTLSSAAAAVVAAADTTTKVDVPEAVKDSNDEKAKAHVAANTEFGIQGVITAKLEHPTQGSGNAQTIAGQDYTRYIQVRSAAVPAETIETKDADNTYVLITPQVSGTISVAYRDQWDSKKSVYKHLKISKKTDGAYSEITTADSYDASLTESTADGYAYTTVTVALEAGEEYALWTTGMGARTYGFTYTYESGGSTPADPTTAPADPTATTAPADPTSTTAPSEPTDAPNVYTFVEGSTVTYTGTAANAGEVPTIVVTAKDGSKVAVDGVSFVMPSQDVTVDVTYAAPVVPTEGPTATATVSEPTATADASEPTQTPAPNPAEFNTYYANNVYNMAQLMSGVTENSWGEATDANKTNYEAAGSPFGAIENLQNFTSTIGADITINNFVVESAGDYDISFLVRKYKDRGFKVVIKKDGETTPAFEENLILPNDNAQMAEVGTYANNAVTILQKTGVALAAGTYTVQILEPDNDKKRVGNLTAVAITKQGETPVYPGKVDEPVVPTDAPATEAPATATPAPATSTPDASEATATPGADPTATPADAPATETPAPATATPTVAPATATPVADSVTLSGVITLTGIYNNADNKKDKYKMTASDLVLEFAPVQGDSVVATLSGVQDGAAENALSYTAELAKETAYTASLKDTDGNVYEISTGASVTTGTEASTQAINAVKTYTYQVPVQFDENSYSQLAEGKEYSISFNKKNDITPATLKFTKSDVNADTKLATVTGHSFKAADTDGASNNWFQSSFDASTVHSTLGKVTSNQDTMDATGTSNPIVKFQTMNIRLASAPSTVEISGEVKVNSSLTANIDPVDAAVTYQWYTADSATAAEADWTAINGATSAALTVPADAAGKYIAVKVTGTGLAGTATAITATAAEGASFTSYTYKFAVDQGTQQTYNVNTNLLSSSDGNVDKAISMVLQCYSATSYKAEAVKITDSTYNKYRIATRGSTAFGQLTSYVDESAADFSWGASYIDSTRANPLIVVKPKVSGTFKIVIGQRTTNTSTFYVWDNNADAPAYKLQEKGQNEIKELIISMEAGHTYVMGHTGTGDGAVYAAEFTTTEALPE